MALSFSSVTRDRRRFRAVVVGAPILTAVLCGSLAVARAGTGGVVSLPLAGTKIRSGLKLQIDTRWVDGTGYRPVRLRVSPIPPGPAPADRSIHITLRPRSWRMGTIRTSVSETVWLPQGATFADVTVSIPQYEMWNNFDIETSEDDRRLRDLSSRYVGFPARTFYNWSEASPSILVLDPAAPGNSISSTLRRANPDSNELPDIRALASRVALDSYNSYAAQGAFNTSKSVDDSDILRLLTDLPRIEILPPGDLTDRWIDLSAITLVVVSLPDLEEIVDSLPERWRAIRQWQACGGTLCVYGVGDGYERLERLEQLVEASSLATDPQRPYARGWSEPHERHFTNDVGSLRSVNGNTVFAPGISMVRADGTAVPQSHRDPPGPKRFLFRRLRQGNLVAIGAENPFPGEEEHWAWLLNSLPQDQWMWYRRHGISMHRDNPEYWELLIPGVGEAPVNSFLVLISLFVIVIGPVNYLVLHRQRRLYLILVTVPLGASVVTLCLLVYALLTDGLGVRQRTRSVTEIDQASGHVVSWSRQSYYAGLSPSSGLSFPKDAAIYPVEYEPMSRVSRDGRNLLAWGDDQRLAEGFLPTRSTKQFLVLESRSTSLGLRVDETGDPPRVTNALGTDIEDLILRTAGGGLYRGARVAKGDTVSLSPVPGKEASDFWSKLLVSNRPMYPEGFDPYKLENAADFFVNYDYSQNVDPGLSEPSFNTSLFERRIRELLANRFGGLQPRSFLATVSTPVEVSTGIADARDEAGFHLVTGSW